MIVMTRRIGQSDMIYRKAIRKKLMYLTKDQLITEIFDLQDTIGQLNDFYTKPFMLVSPMMLEKLRNDPQFIDVTQYAVGVPSLGEVGMGREYRYVRGK